MTELTENLLAKLEEKMMMLLTDMDDMRRELHRVQQENTSLNLEKENHARKLHDLVALLDSVGATDESNAELEEVPAQAVAQG